jgi:glycosyltransferase involved in cell wall biosynthesis
MIRLTIWMNMPSLHQDGLFKALLASGELDLRVVFAAETPPDRLQLGWIRATRDYANRMLSGRFAFWEALRIAWSERGRLHIVSGIWAEPSFAAALCVLALARSRFVVYAEAPDPRQSPAGFRAVLRRCFGGWIAKRALGMLAVSHFAEQFYTQLGFDAARVYRFGYFRANGRWAPGAGLSRASAVTEVIFVGQLIHRKGVELLLEAMRPLFGDYQDLALSVVGDGSEAQALRAAARSVELAGRVNFEGTVSSDKILARIAMADLLVLPSRWDGWGMVVNEALSVGVPVVASDHCGAADIIQHGVNGYVFPSESVDSLRQCLHSFLGNRDRWLAMRSAAASTGRVVSAQSAAPYLIECLKHMIGESDLQPIPPWLPVPASQSASH